MDIGKQNKIVGNINSRTILNEDLFFRYLSAADPFDDPKCKNCKILPFCEGGCPIKRIYNEYNSAKTETCSIYKENIIDFLKLHYESKNI